MSKELTRKLEETAALLQQALEASARGEVEPFFALLDEYLQSFANLREVLEQEQSNLQPLSDDLRALEQGHQALLELTKDVQDKIGSHLQEAFKRTSAIRRYIDPAPSNRVSVTGKRKG